MSNHTPPSKLSSFIKAYRILIRLQRFALAGSLATCLHWSVMAGLTASGVHPWTASSVGTVSGALAGYRLQCHFVFRHWAGRRILYRYLLALALATAANLGVLATLTQGGMTLALAQFISTLSVGVLNFAVLQSCVFGRHSKRR